MKYVVYVYIAILIGGFVWLCWFKHKHGRDTMTWMGSE